MTLVPGYWAHVDLRISVRSLSKYCAIPFRKFAEIQEELRFQHILFPLQSAILNTQYYVNCLCEDICITPMEMLNTVG